MHISPTSPWDQFPGWEIHKLSVRTSFPGFLKRRTGRGFMHNFITGVPLRSIPLLTIGICWKMQVSSLGTPYFRRACMRSNSKFVFNFHFRVLIAAVDFVRSFLEGRRRIHKIIIRDGLYM